MLVKVAWRSLAYRRGAVLITIAAIAVSVFTLLSAEHLRQTAKQSFSSTVSGVDLIVGPRTGDINLLLTTVFRIGHPSQNMSWQSYQFLRDHPKVDWAIPISLGDSHRGFRVVGTEKPFFSHFRYGRSRNLSFSQGEAFANLYDVVLGATVAKRLGYETGEKLIISHGLGTTSFQNHDAYPFTVSGVLNVTGTPVDNALYVSLAGLEALHQPAPAAAAVPPVPKSISAAMVGLKGKLATFKVQRELNTSVSEPLTAILPGVALTQLWQMSRGVERSLILMTQLMLCASLLGLAAVMLATLRERDYELAVLRTLGAGPATVFVLIQVEALLITSLGIALGAAVFVLGTALSSDQVAVVYGIDMGLSQISLGHILAVLYVLAGALAAAALPALIGFARARNL